MRATVIFCMHWLVAYCLHVPRSFACSSHFFRWSAFTASGKSNVSFGRIDTTALAGAEAVAVLGAMGEVDALGADDAIGAADARGGGSIGAFLRASIFL